MLIIEILIIFCFALVSNGNSSVKHIMLALGKDYLSSILILLMI